MLLKRETLASDFHKTANFRASLVQLGHMELAAVAALPRSPRPSRSVWNRREPSSSRTGVLILVPGKAVPRRGNATWGIALSYELFYKWCNGSLETGAFERLELQSELDKLQNRVTAKRCNQTFLYRLKRMHRSVLTGVPV